MMRSTSSGVSSSSWASRRERLASARSSCWGMMSTRKLGAVDRDRLAVAVDRASRAAAGPGSAGPGCSSRHQLVFLVLRRSTASPSGRSAPRRPRPARRRASIIRREKVIDWWAAVKRRAFIGPASSGRAARPGRRRRESSRIDDDDRRRQLRRVARGARPVGDPPLNELGERDEARRQAPIRSNSRATSCAGRSTSSASMTARPQRHREPDGGPVNRSLTKPSGAAHQAGKGSARSSRQAISMRKPKSGYQPCSRRSAAATAATQQHDRPPGRNRRIARRALADAPAWVSERGADHQGGPAPSARAATASAAGTNGGSTMAKLISRGSASGTATAPSSSSRTTFADRHQRRIKPAGARGDDDVAAPERVAADFERADVDASRRRALVAITGWPPRSSARGRCWPGR